MLHIMPSIFKMVSVIYLCLLSRFIPFLERKIQLRQHHGNEHQHAANQFPCRSWFHEGKMAPDTAPNTLSRLKSRATMVGLGPLRQNLQGVGHTAGEKHHIQDWSIQGTMSAQVGFSKISMSIAERIAHVKNWMQLIFTPSTFWVKWSITRMCSVVAEGTQHHHQVAGGNGEIFLNAQAVKAGHGQQDTDPNGGGRLFS